MPKEQVLYEGDMVTVSFRIPKGLREAIERKAKEDHRSMTQVVVQLLEEGLQSYYRPNPDKEEM